jgi:hypothetical protein
MKQRSKAIVVALFVWTCATPGAHAQTVSEILTSLHAISGLAALKPVKQTTMTRAQLRGYFEKRLRESSNREEIRLQELVLKKVGLLPENYDLAGSVVDLMAEQAAAFYDYRQGQLVMLEGASGLLEQMALVHELAHALADQNFHLEKYLKDAGESDEGSMARQAVMEGQAQWLMSEYAAQRIGQSLVRTPGLAQMLMGSASSLGQFPVFDQSPLYLRESLIFPYAAGMRFQQSVVVARGEAGFREVFSKPPANTQEILHPERYLSREGPPAKPSNQAPDPGGAWKLVTEAYMGEFDHSVLLDLYAPDQRDLAEKWRSGAIRVYAEKKGVGGQKRIAFTYRSEWDGPEAAREFFAAYRKVLAGKWKDFRVVEESGDHIRGHGGGGWFESRINGTAVESREGFRESTLKP